MSRKEPSATARPAVIACSHFMPAPLHHLPSSSRVPAAQALHGKEIADSSNKPFPWGMQALFFNPEVNVAAGPKE